MLVFEARGHDCRRGVTPATSPELTCRLMASVCLHSVKSGFFSSVVAVSTSGRKEIVEKSVSSSGLNNFFLFLSSAVCYSAHTTLIGSHNTKDLLFFFHNYLFNLVIEGNVSSPSVTNSAEV